MYGSGKILTPLSIKKNLKQSLRRLTVILEFIHEVHTLGSSFCSFIKLLILRIEKLLKLLQKGCSLTDFEKCHKLARIFFSEMCNFCRIYNKPGQLNGCNFLLVNSNTTFSYLTPRLFCDVPKSSLHRIMRRFVSAPL